MKFVRRFGRFHLVFVACIVLFSVYLIRQAWDTGQLERDEIERYQRDLLAYYHAGNSSGESIPEAPLVYYNKKVPLVWIGGVPRSGTTLMRAMLDAHPDVRCGEETRVIPRIIAIHQGMTKTELEMKRLQEAHITEDVLNKAMGAYILSIISQHGEPAPRLCNKDPFTLRSVNRIVQMFPNSRFLLMIRDGRATVHSIISRNVKIKGFDDKNYGGALKDWNRAMTNMYDQCKTVGESVCLPVHYEQIVLHPKAQMERILKFLDLPWDEHVLHHEDLVGQKGGISLSKRELSTDQVDKPVNTGALTKWAEHIPADVRRDIREIAPMLEVLGYDPDSYPPDYGTPDPQVAAASKLIKAEAPLKVVVGVEKPSHATDPNRSMHIEANPKNDTVKQNNDGIR